MSEHPIILEQVLGIAGLETQFTTHPDISMKQLLKFYSDVSSILRNLDEEINYEYGISKFYEKGSLWTLGIPIKFSGMLKSLQVRTGNIEEFNLDNVVRTHNINYGKKPRGLSEDLKEILKDNMFKSYLMTNSNLTITSTRPIYVADDLVSSLKDLPYVGISDKYDGYVFNPREVIDFLTTGPSPNEATFN